MSPEAGAFDSPRGLHGDRKRKLMRGATKVLATGGDVHRAGQPSDMIEERRDRASEHAPLLAEMLVAMHEDGALLGERRAEPVRSFPRFCEIRAGVDLPVAEHFCVAAAGQEADEHGRARVGKIDAIAGVAQHAREIVQFRHGDLDQLLHRLGDVPDFGFRQRLRRTAARRVELVAEQAASPGIGDPRLGIGVGQMIGDR